MHDWHVLAPGFVLKKDKEEKEDEVAVKDPIERECPAPGPNVTQITLESFLAWQKKGKDKERLINPDEIWKEEKPISKQVKH